MDTQNYSVVRQGNTFLWVRFHLKYIMCPCYGTAYVVTPILKYMCNYLYSLYSIYIVVNGFNYNQIRVILSQFEKQTLCYLCKFALHCNKLCRVFKLLHLICSEPQGVWF